MADCEPHQVTCTLIARNASISCTGTPSEYIGREDLFTATCGISGRRDEENWLGLERKLFYFLDIGVREELWNPEDMGSVTEAE
jgi:hypothetical protein